MSYTTLDVEIEDGRIIPREPGKLPRKASALLTIIRDADAERRPRPFGLAKGEFVVPDDFNEPLPEEIMRGFEGR